VDGLWTRFFGFVLRQDRLVDTAIHPRKHPQVKLLTRKNL